MRLDQQSLRDGDFKLREAAEAIAESHDLNVLDCGGHADYLKLVENTVYEQLVRATAEVDIPPYESWKTVHDHLAVGR